MTTDYDSLKNIRINSASSDVSRPSRPVENAGDAVSKWVALAAKNTKAQATGKESSETKKMPLARPRRFDVLMEHLKDSAPTEVAPKALSKKPFSQGTTTVKTSSLSALAALSRTRHIEMLSQKITGQMIRHDAGDSSVSLDLSEGVVAKPVGQGEDATMAAGIGKSNFPIAPPEQVNDAQLARYAKIIYERTGIRISPQKKMLLTNRLRRRLRQTGIRNFESYYRYLRDLPYEHPEWDQFFQEITTHETFLFRDENQWDWFTHAYLAKHLSQVRKRGEKKQLRIWSAACSTGDEVYTIACCIAANMNNLSSWQFDILGTDIAVGEIDRAANPEFSQRSMRLVPREYMDYFTYSEATETWSPKPCLKKLVRFRSHNLMMRLDETAFDVVFLKNVLIYFDRESKKRALENVCRLIRPGGLLIAGAAEGVSSLVDGFNRIEPWLFQKVKG